MTQDEIDHVCDLISGLVADGYKILEDAGPMEFESPEGDRFRVIVEAVQ